MKIYCAIPLQNISTFLHKKRKEKEHHALLTVKESITQFQNHLSFFLSHFMSKRTKKASYITQINGAETDI